MALSGVHICFGFSSVGTNNSLQGQSSLVFNAVSSQTMAAATTSSISAPVSPNSEKQPVLSISASAAIFYATGPNPDASGSGSYPRRYYDPAASSGREDIFVNPGDKFAWVAA